MKNYDFYSVLKAPIVTEKSSKDESKGKLIAFKVRIDASKLVVKKTVEKLFGVKVESVNILIVKGKSKRFSRYQGRRSDWKKAYVRLKPGFDIDIVSA